MTRLALLLALSLTACTTTRPEPRVITQQVLVPVSQSCVPAELGGPPAYPDDDASLRAAVDGAARYALVAAGRLLRMARQAETESVIVSCRG
jgi:hypothetical protein